MAVSGYGYDPTAKRSELTKEIASDLDRNGVHLDDDTVRKWLKVAGERLPSNLPKQVR